MRTPIAVSLLSLLAVAACGGGDTPDTPADAVSADPAHYAVAFENDAIRVLRITYGAGESSVMHGHPESCAIVLSGGDFTMHLPDGTAVEESLEDGGVRCYPAGAHRPENTSPSGGTAYLVELKQGAAAGTAAMPAEPTATEADPAHYSVEVDNDVYRLVRVGYGAGEASVMHSHPAHCIVYLAPASSVSFQLPDGQTVAAPDGAAGDLSCVDGASHLPTNGSDSAVQVILIEMKGRATAS